MPGEDINISNTTGETYESSTAPDSTPHQSPRPSADTSGPTPPLHQNPRYSHPVLGILGAIAIAILFIGGGILAGTLLSRHNEPSDPSADQTITNQTVGEISVPVENVALIPESDQLVLSFLKLHNTPNNSCYSPLSIRYALSMLSAATDGESKAQIDQLLGNLTPTHYDNIADHLSLANSLWVAESLQDNILPSYTDTIKSQFNAELKIDNFQSAANINQWAKDNTLGLLDQPLTDEDVKGLTAALINALAIDMNWANEFDKLSTRGTFFNFDESSDENQTQYTTLYDYRTIQANSDTDYAYNFASNATVLTKDLKDYNGTGLQFVAIMPDNLQNFIQNTTIPEINTLLSNLSLTKPKNDTFIFNFETYLPKFKIEGGLGNLLQDLKDLGVTDIFDADQANFTNLTDTNGFFIDGMVHETHFDLSEEGIKAAAITVAGGKGSGGYGPIPSRVNILVSINKPFLYLVRDKQNGTIWFIGTVYDPNHWDDDKAAYSHN